MEYPRQEQFTWIFDTLEDLLTQKLNGVSQALYNVMKPEAMKKGRRRLEPLKLVKKKFNAYVVKSD